MDSTEEILSGSGAPQAVRVAAPLWLKVTSVAAAAASALALAGLVSAGAAGPHETVKMVHAHEHAMHHHAPECTQGMVGERRHGPDAADGQMFGRDGERRRMSGRMLPGSDAEMRHRAEDQISPRYGGNMGTQGKPRQSHQG